METVIIYLNINARLFYTQDNQNSSSIYIL